MQRDFKIGLIVGSVLVVGAMAWIATRDRFSPQARLAQQQSIPFTPAETEAPVVPPPADDGATLAIERDTPIETRPLFTGPLAATEEPTPEPAMQPVPVAAPPVNEPPAGPQATVPTYHVVAEGQTLSAIAQRYYGSASQWKRIVEANRDVLPNPSRIRPGLRLRIPEPTRRP